MSNYEIDSDKKAVAKNPVRDSKMKARARIKAIAGARPERIIVNYGLRTSNTRSGRYTDEDASTYIFKGSEIRNDSTSPYIEVSTYATKYWRTFGSATVTFGGRIVGFLPEREWRVSLNNRKAVEYPKYKDRQSNIELEEPPANWSVNQRTPGRTYRDDFIKEYDRRWGVPRYFRWGDVDIHHMKPAKYNGSDSFSNLIPLWSSKATGTNTYKILKHSILNNWWINY